ncbi:hypothetical protein [Pontimicrobium aquaticum]|uniref:Uncharacterized protein n=1 Tax=Pontimicrobium aquaticum TaxID=2565367 RepID=A0A4U0EWV6_9FLAO|nr:hypothetical protein [Pontimicrobium aquaticum]TJY36340.1 hypothetical protein E5167_06650 [Pontimicrobium aquaticum]
MSQDYKNPAFKNLLQKLQEESWQLELLISGFAIFGLFTAYPSIKLAVEDAQNSQQVYKFVIYAIAWVSCAILIFNLMLHVLLRGLWIGTLGLRYVSGDIDYDSLKYSQKFTRYLEKRVGSFDKYIATLEDYCSVIFAVTFLLIFYVLAITFTVLAIGLIASQIIDNDSLPIWLSKGVGISLILFIILGMFLTLIDFITLGFLKKKNWISTIYFPIYWVFSFITLSFLYRPLVYNFLDNRFGRRLSFFLVPFYIIIAITLSLEYKTSNYLETNMKSNEVIANSDNYEDLLTEKSFIDNAAIQSKVITDTYLKVFIVFNENIENRVYNYNKGLQPKTDERGLGSNITLSGTFVNDKQWDSLRREYLKTFNDIYYVKIDSTIYHPEFVFTSNTQNKPGFESFLPTKNLSDGKHVLKVQRRAIKDQDTTYWNVATIPFWYFKD